MAQKKVILKDGTDELLPKTSASMVFTESGQTVENALKNAGGGGTGGIDEEQLAQYLQQYEYITQTKLDEANYLKPTSEITGYTKASSYSALAPTDTLNEAIGKLEAGIGGGGTGVGGNDAYYLPEDVRNLNSSNTYAEVFAALGGTEGYKDLKQAIADKKKICMPAAGLFFYSTQVSACLMVNNVILSYNKPEITGDDITIVLINCNGTEKNTSIKQYYPSGYNLKPQLFELTNSSDSDEISTAVGSESGLKNIIQAVKDGNRLVIRGTLDTIPGFNINQDLQCNLYKEEDNGDITLVLSGKGYYLWGGDGGIMSIVYTKSSNEFSVNIIQN